MGGLNPGCFRDLVRAEYNSAVTGRRNGRGQLVKKWLTNLSNDRKAELVALDELADDQIDTVDVPELLDFSDARRGVFYRPAKQQITLRLDKDVISWFKMRAEGGRGFQTDINRALRGHVSRTEKRTSDA